MKKKFLISVVAFLLVFHNAGYCQSLISAGDEVQLDIAEDEIFSENYIISKDGYINIPYIKKIHLNGLTRGEASDKIKNELIVSNQIILICP